MSLTWRRQLVDRQHPSLSIVRQCALLGVTVRPVLPSQGSLERGPGLDASHGPAISGGPLLRVEAHESLVGASRVSSKPEASATDDAHHGATGHLPSPSHQPAGAGHRVYPYLLENVKVAEPNQVWTSDITYLPMARGFLYLVAWRLSNTLEADCCVKGLQDALGRGRPEIFNTDRGGLFTSREFTQVFRDVPGP